MKNSLHTMNSTSFIYALISLLALSLALFAWHSYWGLWSDVVFYLAAGERVLAGGKLYIDIIDMNPPLAFWLSIPVVKLAQIFFLEAETVFLAGMFLLIWASTAMVWNLLVHVTDNPNSRLNIAVILFLVLALPAGPAFGQREHLAVILLLPYLVLAAGRIQGYQTVGLLVLVVGVFAGIGIGLKPYFLLAIIFIELTVMAYRHTIFTVLRTETLVTIIFLIGYLAIAGIFAPEYFNTILPLAISTYSAFNKSGSEFWLSSWFLITLIALVFAAYLLTSRFRKASLPALLITASTGFLIGFILQGKAFYYQIYPAHALASAALLSLILTARPSFCISLRRCAGVTSVVMASFFLVHYQSILFIKDRQTYEARLLKAIEPARSVVFFTHDIGLTFPFVRENKKVWASSFPAFWPLLGISRAYATGKTLNAPQERALKFMKNTVVKDLEIYKPDIILVDNRSYTPTLRGHSVPYLQILSTNVSFIKQWSHYRKDKEIFEIEIWRRITASDPVTKIQD